MSLLDDEKKRSERIQWSKNIFRSISPGLMGHLFGEDHSMFFRGNVFNISKDSIEDFIRISDALDAPLPTALSANGYYEQVIQVEGRSGTSILSKLGNESGIEIISRDGQMSAKIGAPSDRFVYFNTNVDKMDRYLKKLLIRDRGSSRVEQRREYLGNLFIFHTIKIESINGITKNNDYRNFMDIAESVLFNISYSKGVPVMLSKSWRREVYSMKLRDLDDIVFPIRKYNQDLVAYYNLAIGSDSLIAAFIALYKIIEHFFSESRESTVHEKLSNLLASPGFRHSEANSLRGIQKIVKKFDVNMDEKTMLKGVLSRYIGDESIRDWIIAYESEYGKVFTENKKIFNKELRVNLSESSIFSNCAERIYHVRNAVVHNKEGEESKFVPFSGDEEMLLHEIPFLMFISENLIINTGNPI